MYTTTEKTVAEIATENSASLRVFEALGIDYCCGGKRTLTDACARAGVTVDQVLASIEKAERDSLPGSLSQWTTAKLTALIEEIVNRHHSFVRNEIPRINTMLAKVVARHGATHPETIEVEQLFNALGEELSMHLMKEEQMLFPYIAGLELGNAPSACFETVQMPIARMVAEHEDAGGLLEKLREVTNGYQPPAEACTTYKAAYQGLREFESDLHRHIHLENNILFPRAVELERGL